MKRHLSDWLTSFLEYMEPYEVPKPFCLWSGISVISAALSNKVYVMRGNSKIFPNNYIFIVGPSGTKKSEAMAQAMRLAEHVPEITKSRYSGWLSPEYMVKTLAERFRIDNGKVIENPVLYIVSDELSLTFESRKDARSMIKYLTALYNVPAVYQFQYGTVSRNETSFRHPCINIMACTTPEWLVMSVDESAIAGGFFARVIIVTGQSHKKSPWPEETKDRTELATKLSEDLLAISQMRGEIKMTPNALEANKIWYESRVEPDDDVLIPFHNREQDHVVKTAIALTASMQDKREITSGTYEASINLVEEVKRSAIEVYQLFGSHPMASITDRVLHKIRKSGGRIPCNDLLRAFSYKLDAKGMVDVLNTLVARGDIDIVTERSRVFNREHRVAVLRRP